MKKTFNQKKDIYWINALKALCMIFVYFGHSELYYGTYIQPINQFRLTFNIIAFIYIRGYLLFWKQLTPSRIDANVKNYVKGGQTAVDIFYRIILPSIVFALLVFFPKNLLCGSEITFHDFIYDTIGGTTFGFTCTLVTSYCRIRYAIAFDDKEEKIIVLCFDMYWFGFRRLVSCQQ